MGLYNKNKIRNKNIERFLLIVFGFISLSIILPTQSQTRFLSSLSLNIGIETESFDTVYGEDKEFKTPPTSPQTGSIHLLIHEVDANGNHLGFFNGVTVKLTDPSGETVYQTTISEHNNACEGCNDYEDGWVWFDDIAPGTYGIMAYKDGFQGKAKQADCLTNWTLIDTTIQNSNTENLIAAWDNEVPVSKNNITWCQDLGLMEVSFITPPSVSTNSATNIETNQTTLNGNLTDLGGANTAHVWFVWDTESHNNGDDYADNNRNENIVMDDIGIFDKTITGLSPDTTYHFRAVAETPGGIVYGIDKTFNTLPLPVQCQHNDGVCLEGCTPENDNDCQPYQELGKTISFGSEEGKYPYSPWVMHEPGWESYLIYFIDNYDMQDRISRIENWTDGKTDWDWINRSIVLEGVNPEDKDYLSGSPGVVIDSQETWHMYYVTASGEPGASMILYLHHAVAQAPGINWTKLGKIQIQNVTQPFPSYIETPSPLLIDNKIVLYYVTDTVVRGIRKGKLMKTTSTDGHHFSEPMAVNIADDFVQAGHVKYINGIYYYVYSRNLTDPSQYATHNFLSISTDGINFSKGELLFHRGEETEESDWDSWRAWAPDLLIEDNVLRVYYAGSKYGIGYYNIGLRWFSRSDQICPDCTIERECRNHVVKACTADNAKDHDISGLGNSIDDYWCTYNEHDGCSYAKSGVELVNGQVLQEDPNSNHSWWEGDACGEGEGTSNLYGEKKVYVDDINKYNIKTRVKIDDNSWVWINGQEAPGLHRGCCDWTDWVDTASYLNTGWNTIKFRAEDTCSGGRHFNMDWDVSLKQQQAVHEIPVLEIKYFPDENNDGRLDQEETGRNDTLNSIRTEVRNLSSKTIESLEKASKYHGYKDPNAIASLDYNVIDQKEYLINIPKSTQFAPFANHIDILNNINICDYVDNRGVKEVWIWMYHTDRVVPIESNMAMGNISRDFWNRGYYGDVSNSYQQKDLPVCEKTYTVYNYNYRDQGLGSALENHNHQMEWVFNYINRNLFWNKWVSPFGQPSPQINSCGWSHSPPNTTDGYDWCNKTTVLSNCEDWNPDGSGEIKEINCYTWDSDCEHDCGDFFKIWWMQNLPGKDNDLYYVGKKLRNWWDFIGDFDAALQIGKNLTY